MDPIFSSVSTTGTEALLARLDLTSVQVPKFRAGAFEELVHELRQPLGVIESLAYFLEITAANEQSCRHSQQIQAMVAEMSRIIERHSAKEVTEH